MNTGFGQHTYLTKTGLNASNDIGGMIICFDGFINSSITGAIFNIKLLNLSY